MSCEHCRQIPHHPRCPLAPEPKTSHHCSICKDGIFNGEEYIENDNGYYAHFECIDSTRELANFLGYEIKEMEDENYQ